MLVGITVTLCEANPLDDPLYVAYDADAKALAEDELEASAEEE